MATRNRQTADAQTDETPEPTYKVVAPLVIVKNPENGNKDQYLYAGAGVPSYVRDEDLKRLLAEKLIAKTAEASGSPDTTPDEQPS